MIRSYDSELSPHDPKLSAQDPKGAAHDLEELLISFQQINL